MEKHEQHEISLVLVEGESDKVRKSRIAEMVNQLHDFMQARYVEVPGPTTVLITLEEAAG